MSSLSKKSKISLFIIAFILYTLHNSAQATPQKTKNVELSLFTPTQKSEYNILPRIDFIRNIERQKTIKQPEAFPLALEAGQHTISITCTNMQLSRKIIIKQVLIQNEKYVAYCKATVKRGHSDTGSIVSIDAHLLNADSFDPQQADPTVIN